MFHVGFKFVYYKLFNVNQKLLNLLWDYFVNY